MYTIPTLISFLSLLLLSFYLFTVAWSFMSQASLRLIEEGEFWSLRLEEWDYRHVPTQPVLYGAKVKIQCLYMLDKHSSN